MLHPNSKQLVSTVTRQDYWITVMVKPVGLALKMLIRCLGLTIVIYKHENSKFVCIKFYQNLMVVTAY